ncbi:MAG: Crp/Fnr family transcriptional regulator [Angelakisella sp.]
MQQLSCRNVYEEIFPFWDKLTTSEQESLCRNTLEKSFQKGETIHSAHGKCTGAIVVKSGCIRAYILSESGKEVTLYRLYKGDICMLSASCVLQSITFDVFVDAEEDSECYIINGRAFAALTTQNIYVENFALNMAVSRFSNVMWVMQQILFMSFDRRLAIFLYDEMNKTGNTTIRLTQEQIAKYMGSAREVVSRMLKYYATEGIAEAVRGGVRILDKEKLHRLTL